MRVSGGEKAVGELVEVADAGLTGAQFPRSEIPGAAAKGLYKQCPSHWLGSELVCSYLGVKWRVVLLHTPHLGFTDL